MTLTPIGLDNRYPSVARRRHATGFRHSVNSLGHKASPWGSPFMNLIFLEVSRPCLVVATTTTIIIIIRSQAFVSKLEGPIT